MWYVVNKLYSESLWQHTTNQPGWRFNALSWEYHVYWALCCLGPPESCEWALGSFVATPTDVLVVLWYCRSNPGLVTFLVYTLWFFINNRSEMNRSPLTILFEVQWLAILLITVLCLIFYLHHTTGLLLPSTSHQSMNFSLLLPSSEVAQFSWVLSSVPFVHLLFPLLCFIISHTWE